MSKKVIVAFYNMGGPASAQDVQRFLTALFTDPDLLDIPLGTLLQGFVARKIIGKRLHEVQERYTVLGGASPQLGITENLARAVKTRLAAAPRKDHAIVDVVPLMRYSEPGARALLDRVARESIDEIWLFAQYPHCARPTTGTSLRELAHERSRHKGARAVTVRAFANYHDDPAFIELWTKRVSQVWQSLASPRKYILVSAHNLPLSYVAQGDPYPRQIHRTAREVMRRLGLTEHLHWGLAWQSAVGPVAWMKPETQHEIKRLADRRVESMAVWPVAFVSDHIETLHEIDIEYAELAHGLGIKEFRRIPNLNADADFSEFLATRILEASAQLAAQGMTSALRDLDANPSGEGCHLQPGGCLCGRYFASGKQGLLRGTVARRMAPMEPTDAEREQAFESQAYIK